MESKRPPIPDPDDWWDQPVTTADWDEQGGPGRPSRRPDDEWLAPRPAPSRTRLWLAAGVAAAVVLLVVAGLWAGGVFGGSSNNEATPPTTTPTTTPATTPSTTTTPQTTTPAAPAPTVTLKPGATGDDVKTLQRALVSLGYDVGTVDGNYGPKTVAAVKAFQAKAGLTQDGVLGPKTLAALKTAVAQGTSD